MVNKSWSDRLFRWTVGVILGLFSFLTAYPFYVIIINSLSDANAVLGKMALVAPVDFTMANYVEIFRNQNIAGPMLVSVSRTIIGALSNIVVNAMLAYALSKQRLPGQKMIYRFFVFSMYISAGLIPYYVTMMAFGFKNTFWIYVLPGMVWSYNMILIRVNIQQLPTEMEESAAIDGAGYYTVFFRIIMPMIVPILATIITFSAVSQWNAWTDNLYFNTDERLMTLQYMLLRFIQTASVSVSEAATLGGDALKERLKVNPRSIRMAATVIVVLPVMLVYPFMQRYFVKGIMIGALKG